MKLIRVKCKDGENDKEVLSISSYDQAVDKITEALKEATSEYWEDKIVEFIKMNEDSTLPETQKFVKQAQDKLKKLQKIKSVISSNWK